MEAPISPCAEPAPPRVQLPIELILLVVDCVPPSKPNAILPASHSATKALRAFTLVCHATRHRAQRLLQQHCAFLDTAGRVACFLRCLQLVDGLSGNLKAPLRQVPAMYLAPFGRTLDDISTASWARELLFEVCPTLRRLIVRMPFSTLHPLDDHLSVRRTLREGFDRLTQLEEFVCLDEYPDLNTAGGHGPPAEHIWIPWPKLKRLLLFGVEMDDERMWENIAQLPQLTDVVLARPKHVGVVDIKREYFAAGDRLLEKGTLFAGNRRVRIMLMDVTYDARDIQTHGWAERDPTGAVAVEMYEVPTSYYGDETAQETVASWVRRGAWNGQLWDWRGDAVA